LDTRVDRTLFNGLTKGLPLSLEPIRLDEIAGKAWNLLKEDLPLPAAVLRKSALKQNSLVMQEFLSRTSTMLCPHGKTTMSPQLFRQQMQDGAWGITVATPQQILVARRFCFDRILLANQLLGRNAIQFVLGEIQRDPRFDFYCLVDSLESVELLLEETLRNPIGRPLQVLVEVGFPGQRCGARRIDDILRIAQSVKNSEPALALRGVEGFEGLFQFQQQQEQNCVTVFLELIGSALTQIERQGLFAPGDILLTAGGSAYFDLVADVFTSALIPNATRIILRSGCYLIHDSGLYAKLQEHRRHRQRGFADWSRSAEHALEIWAYVQSVPESQLAIATAGKRDCGHDSGMPVPIKWFSPRVHTRPMPLDANYSVTNLSDHHAHIRLPYNHDFKVGDLVCLGVSHPCTTLDKWKVIYEVDDFYNITSAFETYF
jgi:D-serine dehydratase